MGERQESGPVRELTETARMALPHVPPFPGAHWFEISDNVPRNKYGRSRPYRHIFPPLIAAGLIVKHQPPRREDGTMPFALFYLSEAGKRALKGQSE